LALDARKDEIAKYNHQKAEVDIYCGINQNNKKFRVIFYLL
jgi:acetyl esterase/lipase